MTSLNSTSCDVTSDSASASTVDTILDLGRNVVPENIFASTFEIIRTERSVGSNGEVIKTQTKVRSVNVLGLIASSIGFGIALGTLISYFYTRIR